MKQTSITRTSVTTDDDAPKLTPADFDHARFRVGGKPASRAEWQTAVRVRIGKQRINIMLDTPIVDHFKALAGERGYQTLINDTLRRVIESGHLEADIRRVVREELRQMG
ncbi:MAG: BrnA antitoxin family protein [Desulfobulbus sp.]|nr:BrnA antitoxin family protein [Desulfobulbus sp.]